MAMSGMSLGYSVMLTGLKELPLNGFPARLAYPQPKKKAAGRCGLESSRGTRVGKKCVSGRTTRLAAS
jgi:hypothetical protein